MQKANSENSHEKSAAKQTQSVTQIIPTPSTSAAGEAPAPGPGPSIPRPPALPALPEIYYDHRASIFWVKDNRGVWIKLHDNSVRRHLVSLGHSNRRGESELSPADTSIHRIQIDQNVDYAGGLAGHASGFRSFNESRILVTEGPRLIESSPGEFPLLKAILAGMLVDGEIDQRPYLFGWLKVAMQCYRNHRWSPGQALALAGPTEAGKSLLQNIITECFGGRSADAHLYISGRSNFNSEMFRAEHLMLEDKSESVRIEVRREMASRLKEITANQYQHCHGKQREGLQLDPIWRISLSLNDEPERIMVLPPLDPDIAGKVILLKVLRRAMPMPTSTDEAKQTFRQALSRELPAFLDHLEQWQIPESMRDSRYGIRYFHHPDLLVMLEATAPEFRLQNLIDRELFREPGNQLGLQSHPEANQHENQWEGSAFALEQHLKRELSSVRREAEHLLTFNTACGSYLARLRSRRPPRVASRTVNGETVWTIQPPQAALRDANPAAQPGQ